MRCTNVMVRVVEQDERIRFFFFCTSTLAKFERLKATIISHLQLEYHHSVINKQNKGFKANFREWGLHNIHTSRDANENHLQYPVPFNEPLV
mmetsp:Transcript_12828/g.16535  ORF Transcript_12828/g.16535 Transcript_12828/m.16535 type:complete len:92 (-) Transcript_12828:241-516(-)